MLPENFKSVQKSDAMDFYFLDFTIFFCCEFEFSERGLLGLILMVSPDAVANVGDIAVVAVVVVVAAAGVVVIVSGTRMIWSFAEEKKTEKFSCFPSSYFCSASFPLANFGWV